MSLDRLGWNEFFSNQLSPGGRVARVVEEQRGLYGIDGDITGWADLAGRIRHAAQSRMELPTVGDWVLVSPAGERAVIVGLLTRRSALVRAAAGDRPERQLLAANIDTVFIVAAADAPNVNRLERYSAMVWESGAVPVIVLNKADLAVNADAVADDVRARVAFVDVIAISAKTAHGVDALDRFLPRGTTVAMVGPSGVGKSTLMNRLLGANTQATGEIRAADGRGRHTTTSRQLRALAAGALLIDTPGIRELQVWGTEETIDRAFDDVIDLAQACRFADCRHQSEPGCAVRGQIDEARLANYQKLQREAAFEAAKRDKAAAAERKRKWKQIGQAQKEMYKRRGR